MSDININQNEQAREAERAVLGGLMLETQRFDTVIQVIKENDFDGKDHQIIFQSMSELIAVSYTHLTLPTIITV